MTKAQAYYWKLGQAAHGVGMRLTESGREIEFGKQPDYQSVEMYLVLKGVLNFIKDQEAFWSGKSDGAVQHRSAEHHLELMELVMKVLVSSEGPREGRDHTQTLKHILDLAEEAGGELRTPGGPMMAFEQIAEWARNTILGNLKPEYCTHCDGACNFSKPELPSTSYNVMTQDGRVVRTVGDEER